jgi:hypothetical protein
MSLLAAFLAIVQDWRGVFPRQPTFERGVRQALGSLICLGRRCLTRIIWTNGGLESQLERGVFPPLALPVGAATVVPAHPETSVETRGGDKVAGGTGRSEKSLRAFSFLGVGGMGYWYRSWCDCLTCFSESADQVNVQGLPGTEK